MPWSCPSSSLLAEPFLCSLKSFYTSSWLVHWTLTLSCPSGISSSIGQYWLWVPLTHVLALDFLTTPASGFQHRSLFCPVFFNWEKYSKLHSSLLPGKEPPNVWLQSSGDSDSELWFQSSFPFVRNPLSIKHEHIIFFFVTLQQYIGCDQVLGQVRPQFSILSKMAQERGT